ncbi:MAG: hypothetical protein AAGA87_13735 [Pseudomonadota bacterium]
MDTTNIPADQETVDAMTTLWNELCGGDRSCATAVACPPNPTDRSCAIAVRGSVRDRFWSMMVSLDWAEPRPEHVEHLPSKDLVAFTLKPSGQTMLPKFLQSVSAI